MLVIQGTVSCPRRTHEFCVEFLHTKNSGSESDHSDTDLQSLAQMLFGRKMRASQ
jgi:hypothetical protein